MKQIIITGGLGHIGSMLACDAAKKFPGYKICIIDNLMTMRFASIFNFKNYKNIYFYEIDLSKKIESTLFKKNSIIINLAAITDAAGSFNNSHKVEKNNLTILKNLVNISKKKNCRLIHLSSTSVYGTQSDLVDEDCKKSELKPQSPYAESKLKEEEFLKKHKNSVSYICLRFGTIYGFSVGMRFHTAVNKFCWQAANDQQITVWKTAFDQKRPYLDLKDACRAIVFLIERNIFNNEVYNVLTHNLTVREVVNVLKRYKPKLKVKFVNSKIMNQLSYDVSNKKFQELGFKFKGNLDGSIKKTLKNLLNNV